MNFINNIKSVIYAFRNEPFQFVVAKIWRRISNPAIIDSQIHYTVFDKALTEKIKEEEQFSEDQISESSQTLISFITPVFNPESQHLQEMLTSVFNQSYPHWELCLHDDGSNPKIVQLLKDTAQSDERIKLSLSVENQGIVNSSNKAIQLASGKFIAFLDHDDTIHPMTAELLVTALLSKPETKLLFSNEDSIDASGYIKSFTEKLAFGQNTLRSINYINHLTIVEKALGDSIGWLNPDVEGAQDYDLLLRISEAIHPSEVQHLPYRLYHWRQSDTSISKHAWQKDYVNTSARKALDQHLERLGTGLLSGDGVKLGTFRLIDKSESDPLTYIDYDCQCTNKELKKSIESILTNTRYSQYKIIASSALKPIIKSLNSSRYPNHLFIERSSINEAEDYLICHISKPILIEKSNWLKELTIYHEIKSNKVVSPMIISPNKRVMSEGLFNKNGNLTNSFKSRRTSVYLDYFAGIPKDTDEIYNICYLRGKYWNQRSKTIVINPYSEVILPIDSDIDQCSILELS